MCIAGQVTAAAVQAVSQRYAGDKKPESDGIIAVEARTVCDGGALPDALPSTPRRRRRGRSGGLRRGVRARVTALDVFCPMLSYIRLLYIRDGPLTAKRPERRRDGGVCGPSARHPLPCKQRRPPCNSRGR